MCLWLRCHSTDCSTCLLKLFHVHLAVTVQIKHLKGDFKIPLGSFMKNPTKHKNQLAEIQKLNLKKGTNSEWLFQKVILPNSFNFSKEIWFLGTSSYGLHGAPFTKGLDKELWGGDITGTFILFIGGKSLKTRCHLIFLTTINRKWCCSKSSSLFHAVKHQFSQKMFLRHCTVCASHGWGADLESVQFSALASLYKFKQIMPTLSQPSHDIRVRCGLELTSWDSTVPYFSLHLVCAVTVYLVRTAKASFPSQPRSFPCMPLQNFSTFPFQAL